MKFMSSSGMARVIQLENLGYVLILRFLWHGMSAVIMGNLYSPIVAITLRLSGEESDLKRGVTGNFINVILTSFTPPPPLFGKKVN